MVPVLESAHIHYIANSAYYNYVYCTTILVLLLCKAYAITGEIQCVASSENA